MSESITPKNDDEIDLFELALTLWEGKWTIIIAAIGAILLGMLYCITLPSSYSGTTILRAAQPSAFTRYAFLSETIRTLSETIESDDFNYKIDNEYVSDAFISEFNDLEEIVQVLNTNEYVLQQLSKIEEQDRANSVILLAKQFQIVPLATEENGWELKFTWVDPEAGKKIFDQALHKVLANVKDTLISDIDQFAEGVQKRLDAKIENATLEKAVIQEGIRLADEQRLLYLSEQATIARELGVAAAVARQLGATTDLQDSSGLLDSQANRVSLKVTSSLPFYMRGYKAIEKEITLIENRSPVQRLALSEEHAAVQQEIFALKNDVSVAQLLSVQKMIETDDPTRWVLFDFNLADVKSDSKRSLILALSLVLGGFIGMVFVLLRSAVRKRRIN